MQYPSSTDKYAIVTEEYAIAAWRNVLVVVWGRATPLHGVTAVVRRAKRLFDEVPGGIFLLIVVEATAKPPESKTRRELGAAMDTLGEMVLSASLVIVGSSMRSSWVRGVTTGLLVFLKQPFPLKVTTFTEAQARFTALGEPPRDLDGLLAEVEAIRSSLGLNPEVRSVDTLPLV